VSCGVGCRRGSDPALLWLWRRPVATAPIRPLAWEPPYAAGAAQEIAKRQKKKKKKKREKTVHRMGENICRYRILIVAQQKQTRLVSMRMQVQYLALLSGLRIWHCCELWCLRSGVPVAVTQASSFSSNVTPNPGTSIYHPAAIKKIFYANHISDKGLASRIYKELSGINNKKT